MTSVLRVCTEKPINAQGQISAKGTQRTFSSIALVVGICAPVILIIIPLVMGLGLPDAALRLIALVPPVLMLAGLSMAVVALRHEEPGRLALIALAWNGLLLMAYCAIFAVLFMNPVTPS